MEREAAFSKKVHKTTEEVDVAFSQLRDTSQALVDTNAEKEAQTQELSKQPHITETCGTCYHRKDSCIAKTSSPF